MFTSSDSEQSQKSHVSVHSSEDENSEIIDLCKSKRQKVDPENTDTPEFLEASYRNIDVTKESKNFSTMHCLSELNSNLSNLSSMTTAPI